MRAMNTYQFLCEHSWNENRLSQHKSITYPLILKNINKIVWVCFSPLSEFSAKNALTVSRNLQMIELKWIIFLFSEMRFHLIGKWTYCVKHWLFGMTWPLTCIFWYATPSAENSWSHQTSHSNKNHRECSIVLFNLRLDYNILMCLSNQ